MSVHSVLRQHSFSTALGLRKEGLSGIPEEVAPIVGRQQAGNMQAACVRHLSPPPQMTTPRNKAVATRKCDDPEMIKSLS